jgi:hypothetical protein
VKPAKVQSWTSYSVNVRFGSTGRAPVKTNIARLTPLPSAGNPAAMFMGVFAGGTQAVFALGQSIGHTGAGWCRPSHSDCAAIILKPGQSEHLTIPSTTGGTPQQFVLHITRISSSVTHSHKVALGAYERYSTAGLCDLALASPVLYDPATGTVQGIPKSACTKHPTSVPFSYLVTAR